MPNTTPSHDINTSIVLLHCLLIIQDTFGSVTGGGGGGVRIQGTNRMVTNLLFGIFCLVDTTTPKLVPNTNLFLEKRVPTPKVVPDTNLFLEKKGTHPQSSSYPILHQIMFISKKWGTTPSSLILPWILNERVPPQSKKYNIHNFKHLTNI